LAFTVPSGCWSSACWHDIPFLSISMDEGGRPIPMQPAKSRLLAPGYTLPPAIDGGVSREYNRTVGPCR
jgi:hypothetical protein